MRTPLLPHLYLHSDGLWFSAVRYVLTIVKPAFFVKTGIFDSSIKTALYRYFSWGWEILRLIPFPISAPLFDARQDAPIRFKMRICIVYPYKKSEMTVKKGIFRFLTVLFATILSSVRFNT